MVPHDSKVTTQRGKCMFFCHTEFSIENKLPFLEKKLHGNHKTISHTFDRNCFENVGAYMCHEMLALYSPVRV